MVNERCHVCGNKRCQRVILASSLIRKFQMQFKNKCNFWKGGTCSYFLSFCQQLNSCVPNGLKLSQNIVWQPWKQNLTIIDFRSIHSMNPHIPQSGETVETGGGEHRYLFLNFVESTWPKKVWTRYWPHYCALFLKVQWNIYEGKL